MCFNEDIFVSGGMHACCVVINSYCYQIVQQIKLSSHVACVPLLAPCVLDDP